MSPHRYPVRLPDGMYEQLDQIAQANNCSVNTLIVNTLGSAMSSGSSVSWTQTFNYAPITSGTFQAFSTTNTTEEEV